MTQDEADKVAEHIIEVAETRGAGVFSQDARRILREEIAGAIMAVANDK